MTKQTKLVATLSAAALLAVGMSAVSFAAGWDNSTGAWQWIGNDGVAVVDTWKQANGNWFYLGSDGNMVTNALVEDESGTKTRYYYVDQYGAMVTNTWKAVAMDDDENSDLDAEYWWYYFGSDGKAYTSSDTLTKSEIKTINGLKYAFDDEGHMLYGWINAESVDQADDLEDAWKTANYYFNGWNDGHMQTGWKQLTVVNDGEDKTYWFYFGNDGKKVADKVKKINGLKYHFDANGAMKDEWVEGTNSDLSASTSVASISYLNGDGSERKNKWVWAVAAEDYIPSDYNDDEYSWWYFGKDGKLYADAIKKINGKKYAFDEKGRMMTGLVSADKNNKNTVDLSGFGDLTRESFINDNLGGDLQDGLFYFSTDEEKDGSMKVGYQRVELDDGSYQMYFDTKTGSAKNGYDSKIKKLVANGLVMAPTVDDESNYMGVMINNDDPKKATDVTGVAFGEATKGYVLVNKAGTIMTKKTNIKDENDVYYCTDENGIVTYVGLEKRA